MDDVNLMLEKLDYKNVLYYFTEISRIPRGSGNNQGISSYLVQFAKKLGLSFHQDEALNVIIYKDASAGYEHAAPVIIQGHMDMVCVKEEDSQHDFLLEGLNLYMDGDDIGAEETTLGGDDGIAVAYALALLSDHSIKHPALEIVITTDEETGMDGAKALDTTLLKGKYLINIDSEDEGVALISCAGGMRFYGELPIKRMDASGIEFHIAVSGLKGGHSGCEIHEYRTNAVLLLARILMGLREKLGFALVEMSGGEKDNAIPFLSEAKLLIHEEDTETARKFLEEEIDQYKKELSGSEPNLKIYYQENEFKNVMAIHTTSFEKILFALIQAPNGVQVMSAHVSGLVESSLNLGIFQTKQTKAVFHYSIRSAVSSYKYYLKDKLCYLFDFLGGENRFDSEYPAWEYKTDSRLRDMYCQVFQSMYGTVPTLKAIHAGLECGILCDKIPNLDVISIGPDMSDIHTPKERLSISSSIRVYQFLEQLLKEMKE